MTRLRKLLAAVVSALAAFVTLALCWREGTQPASGYEEFAGCPTSIQEGVRRAIPQKWSEMTELRKQFQRRLSEVKFHSPGGLNKPIKGATAGLLGINCYVGYPGGSLDTRDAAVAASTECCAEAENEIEKETKTNPFYEQSQLKESLV